MQLKLDKRYKCYHLAFFFISAMLFSSECASGLGANIPSLTRSHKLNLCGNFIRKSFKFSFFTFWSLYPSRILKNQCIPGYFTGYFSSHSCGAREGIFWVSDGLRYRAVPWFISKRFINELGARRNITHTGSTTYRTGLEQNM